MFTALLFAKARTEGGAGFVAWGAVALAGSALAGKRFPVARIVGVLALATAAFLVVVSYAAGKLG